MKNSLCTALIIIGIYLASVLLAFGLLNNDSYWFRVDLCKRFPTVCYLDSDIRAMRSSHREDALISITPVAGISAALIITFLYSADQPIGLRFTLAIDPKDFKFVPRPEGE